jgi:hypothetical protein
MDTVRVQAIQLRRKRRSTSNLQAQFKLRLPGIEEPAQFHLAYVVVRPDSARIGAGDRQKIQGALVGWQAVFLGPYDLRWDDRRDRPTLVMAFVDRTDGAAREHCLGWPRRHRADARQLVAQAVRSRLLEIAEVRIEIDWISADARFRALVEEIARASRERPASAGAGSRP